MSADIELPAITDEDRELFHYNPNTDDIIERVQAYARAAVLLDRQKRGAGPTECTACGLDPIPLDCPTCQPTASQP